MSAQSVTPVAARHDLEMSDAGLPDGVEVARPTSNSSSSGNSRYMARATAHGTIELSGIVDTFSSVDVSALLAHAVDESLVPVIDVSRLEFADVAGMRTVAAAAQRLETRHGEARIKGASTQFRKVWSLLGYDSLTGVRLEP